MRAPIPGDTVYMVGFAVEHRKVLEEPVHVPGSVILCVGRVSSRTVKSVKIHEPKVFYIDWAEERHALKTGIDDTRYWDVYGVALTAEEALRRAALKDWGDVYRAEVEALKDWAHSPTDDEDLPLGE